MYVVFTDPYYKEFKFFDGIRHPVELLNGYYINYVGDIQHLVSELLSIEMISWAGNGCYRIKCRHEIADPESIIKDIRIRAENLRLDSREDFRFEYLYREILPDWRLSPRYIERVDDDKSVKLAKLLKVADQYGDAVADFEIAIQGSQYEALFQANQLGITALDADDVWNTIVPYNNGDLHIMVRGIGTGKLFTWPNEIKSCSNVRCGYGNARHKLEMANHHYHQINYLISSLSHYHLSLIPTKVKFNINASGDYRNEYRDGWQPNRYPQRDLPAEYKTLVIWSEFTPKTPE